MRRQALRGARTGDLALLTGASPALVRRAIFGRAPYQGIVDPGPLRPGDVRAHIPAHLPKARVVKGPHALLTLGQVREVRRRGARGPSVRVLPERFHVSLKTTRYALCGRPPYTGVTDPPALSPERRGATRALGDARVQSARRLRRQGATVREIAHEMGVSGRTAMTALLGRGPYAGIGRPSPLRPGAWSAVRALDDEKVRYARRRRLAGDALRGLARALEVSEGTVAASLYGRSPYAGIERPGPLAPVRRAHPKALDRSEIPSVRRRRRTGAPIERLARLYGCSRRSLRLALHGLGPYAGIRDPPALLAEVPRRPGHPALSEPQVQEARRRRTSGEGMGTLLQRFSVGYNGLHRALTGVPPYDRIRDPGPLKPRVGKSAH